MRGHGLRLSVTTQIIREYIVVLTRGSVFEKQFSIKEVLDLLTVILPQLELIGEPVAVTEILQEIILHERVKGKRVHDANIVTVMRHHGIERLATYNRGDFEHFPEINLETPPAE